ncbi:hypothetical protein NQZ79_g1335 [Umbelopsis isabellina]|nr:hypothetical protein NQZ79_g1335 [Umbelopsis isabellina]
MGSPIPDRTSPSSPPSPEPLRKDSVSSSISLLLNVDEKSGNQNMDTLAKAAFSADSVSDRQHNHSHHTQTGHLPTPQSPAVSFPPMMVSRDEGMNRSNTERWSRSASSSVRDSQSPPSINATVPAIASRPGYGSFPLKSASTDDSNSLSSDKPYCEVCRHQFRRHHDLKRHQKLHTGERPYVCDVCDRSFARLDALNRHRRAEGGSACNSTQNQRRLSQPQPQNANSPPNQRRDSQGSESMGVAPPRSRPSVPELQIPHPESRPFENDSGRRSLSLDEYRTHEKPSPFRASTYPDPNSASGTGGPVFPPPHGTSTTSQPPQPSQREQKLEQSIALLSKRNRELEVQLAAQSNSGELDRLQSRVHDLEVENKVLRSLILQNKDAMEIPSKKRRFLEATSSSSGSPGATEDIEMRDTAEAY